MPAPTLHYWLDGGTQRGKTYRPVIRVVPQTRRLRQYFDPTAGVNPAVSLCLVQEIYARPSGVPGRSQLVSDAP